MISYLKGKILLKKSNYLILEVNNVGYQVFLNEKALTALADQVEICLYTHHYIKEDSQELYGFLSQPELELFKNLICISGIGPKTAMNVLAVASVEDIMQAILSEDPALLKTVSGIGTKTAERIVIELKSKIGALSKEIIHKDIQAAPKDIDVIEALLTLGYSRKEVLDTVRLIPADLMGTSDRIRGALKLLGKR